MSFADKYQKAIIFLAVVLLITVLLVLLYLILKKGMCNCFGDKKKTDEEEGLYTDTGEDVEDEHDDKELDIEDDDLPPPADECPPNFAPEVVVTEAAFIPEKKSKKKHFSSMLKKIKKPKGNVHFASESTALVETPAGSQDSGYGATLAPLRRTDSMESFMSGMSTVTTNVEEFGEELSPSRIQISIEYDPKKWCLAVGAKQAECLITTGKEKMYWQVHITLLPFKKQRFKTRYKSSSTPIFNQTFDIENIAQQALSQLSVRFRIYGRPGRAGRKKLAGETEVELSHIMQMEDNIIKDWRVLKRKTVGEPKRETVV